MVELKRFIRKMFSKEKAGSESHESPDTIYSMFKTRYWNFKTLLDTNHRTLEIMSDMEHALQGNHSFGMAFIRANCTAISVNLYKLIEKINEISSRRYESLYSVFAEIQNKINQILEEQKELRDGELALPLDAVNKDGADHVGSKMANLGEIMNRVGLRAPAGFVITASAYKLFVDHNNLQKEINQQLQSVDFADMEMLYETSADIQELIMRSSLPPELEGAICDAYRCLEEKTEKGVHVSLRSSALGEDTQENSFAGQYHSELNVSRESLIHTYKNILASKYSPRAITYRLNKGFRDEDIMMCVGCMAMVEAVSSGVMYSRDPGNIRNKLVLINAVRGLAKSVVDGSVSPDFFVVSREPAREIIKKEIHAKGHKVVCSGGEGISRIELTDGEKGNPAVTDDQALLLAELAERLEDHYGTPQDIEWAIGVDGQVRILQSRYLKQLDTGTKALKDMAVLNIEQPIIVEGGVTASPGVACGPAFIVNKTQDILQFPHGAVLVAKHALPQLAALLNGAVAVITDRGGIAGHLATVSREFGIPALFDTGAATSRIKNGAIVTVDADARKVYEGKVESLLKEMHAGRVNLLKGSPVHTTLKKVLKYITPLNLTQPEGDNFIPEGCLTYHDIIRFCHEKAVNEMFDFGENNNYSERAGKRLVVNVPTQWWIIDLGDGFKRRVEGDTVELGDIASVPMLALWEGITAVPWEGPPPIDTKGFLSVMFESTMNPNLCASGQSCYMQKNCAMISRNFCNLSCRVGYHFSVAQAFLSERPRENYIKFGFKGGAADLNRKARRMKLIEEILTRFDFRVEIYEDVISAHLEGYDQDFLKKRLKVLGYLIMHTRQLDMIMGNDAHAGYYRDKLLADIHSFS